MNQHIIVRIPPNSLVRRKIQSTYRDLYLRWRTKYPTSTAYSMAMAMANYRNVVSIHGKVFPETAFHLADRYWHNGIVIGYSHWFFLVEFQTNKRGQIIASIKDACYEGDYHNDTMNTTPYDESILKNQKTILEKYLLNDNRQGKTKFTNTRQLETKLKNIISESVRTAFAEIYW